MARVIDLTIVLTNFAFILAASATIVVRMYRRGRITDAYSRLSVLPRPLRQWMYGELSTRELLGATRREITRLLGPLLVTP